MPRPLPRLLPWLLLALGVARAQETAAPQLTREDVALALVRCEQALAQALPRLQPDELALANRAFDRATLAYFAGDKVGTLRQVDALTLRLLGRQDDPTAQAAIRLRLRVISSGPEGGQALRLEPLYPLPLGVAPPRAAQLTLLATDGRRATSVELAPEPLTAPEGAALSLPALAPGFYRLRLTLAEGDAPLPSGVWTCTPRDLDAAREELAARLAALPPAGDEALAHARECAAARLALVRATPDPEDTAQTLADPLALLAELEQEVAALGEGRDPYRARPGEQWRAFRAGKQLVRYRVQAPRAALEQGGPLPVLIAFHGYQGDENMFRFAYGGGRLFELCEAQGVLLVTPRTEPFLQSAALLDRLLDELADDYPIDRTRVWLLGHSMGAQAAGLLARARAERLAGVALFAGGPMGGEVPIHAWVGALDMAGAMVRTREGVERLEGWGHTLGVGPYLERALEWLRAQPPRGRRYF